MFACNCKAGCTVGSAALEHSSSPDHVQGACLALHAAAKQAAPLKHGNLQQLTWPGTGGLRADATMSRMFTPLSPVLLLSPMERAGVPWLDSSEQRAVREAVLPSDALRGDATGKPYGALACGLPGTC